MAVALSHLMHDSDRDASLASAEKRAIREHHPALKHEPARDLKHVFQKFAQKSSAAVGSPWAFLVAVLIIIAWAATGPIFHYSDTWQLIINTGTTIVTFLMVFLIQNTQNRDAKA